MLAVHLLLRLNRLITLCRSAAVSFMVAEQFSEALEMEAITRAAKYGRMTGEASYAVTAGFLSIRPTISRRFV